MAIMERVCFLLQVRPDKIVEYEERHQTVWEEMKQALSETGWRNYSLFLRDDGLLVGYLETDDFEQAKRRMEDKDVNTRWQQEMSPYFVGSGNGGRPAFQRLREVFHLD